MDGILSTTGVFYSKNTQYHNDFFREILKDSLTEQPFTDILSKDYIVFYKNTDIDNVLFSPTINLSEEQLIFFKKNIHHFSLHQQFIINSFLQKRGIKPLNSAFIKEKCIDCIMYENYVDYFSGKNEKPTPCMSCNKENKNEHC